jgi:hypothetical protein
MKKITTEQCKAILDLLVKYNVGVNEYSAVQNLFEKLPVIEEKTDDKSKEFITEQK